MTFVQRQLAYTIQLGQGAFGQSGFNTISLSGLRSSCVIEKCWAPSADNAIIRIFGVSLDHMNAISTHWAPYPLYRNDIVTVTAGDAVAGMSTVFKGGIRTAWANLQSTPEDAVLEISGYAGFLAGVQPAQPQSFKGGQDVSTILAGIAKQLGLQFEGNGVSVILNNQYLDGTLFDQAKKAAANAGVVLYIDELNNTLAIWPSNGIRQGGTIPLISPSTGLVNYPKYTGSGIGFKAALNPTSAAIRVGGQVQVQSSIKAACGTWTVSKLTYDLASMAPRGPWFVEVEGWIPGLT